MKGQDDVEIIDGDGLPSLVETCLGLDWKQPSTDTLQLPTETEGRLSWQSAKGTDIEGIFPIIEISYDLETWSDIPLDILNDTASGLMVREPTMSASPQKFIRLRASLSPPSVP